MITAKSPKAKSTPSLTGFLKPGSSPIVEKKSEPIKEIISDQPVTLEKLKVVWEEFTEGKSQQAAEYQILKREFRFEPPSIIISLTNPVEETLLDNFRRDFTQFLRDRLRNSALSITAELKESTGKKIVYTSKEKFEHLAEKNPYLLELKKRLDLDWDF